MNNLVLEHEFEAFSTRKSFNRNLRHFKAVNSLIESVNNSVNLADAVSKLLASGEFELSQILPLLNSVLVEKYGYRFLSLNLKKTISDLTNFPVEFQAWKACDLVFVYHDPESGIVCFNPKNPAHWNSFQELRNNEFLVCYVGFGSVREKLDEKKTQKIILSAFERLSNLFSVGKAPKLPQILAEGDFLYKNTPEKSVKKPLVPRKTQTKSSKIPASAEKSILTVPETPAPSLPPPAAVRQVVTNSGKMIVSPKIPILVTNELFHNGNVEAWKKIISSYNSKYPQCRVNVYYDGELILDINSLFKWGKVKHGTAILVSVSSPDEKLMDLSKLRKYLLEGASPRFEYFLKGAPGKTLELF
jgi:hypothetical protein